MGTIAKAILKVQVAGDGYKPRTALEAALAKGVSIPVLPEGATGETYPALCVALGTIDLRTVAPVYVTTRDLLTFPDGHAFTYGEAFSADAITAMAVAILTPNGGKAPAEGSPKVKAEAKRSPASVLPSSKPSSRRRTAWPRRCEPTFGTTSPATRRNGRFGDGASWSASRRPMRLRPVSLSCCGPRPLRSLTGHGRGIPPLRRGDPFFVP